MQLLFEFRVEAGIAVCVVGFQEPGFFFCSQCQIDVVNSGMADGSGLLDLLLGGEGQIEIVDDFVLQLGFQSGSFLDLPVLEKGIDVPLEDSDLRFVVSWWFWICLSVDGDVGSQGKMGAISLQGLLLQLKFFWEINSKRFTRSDYY